MNKEEKRLTIIIDLPDDNEIKECMKMFEQDWLIFKTRQKTIWK